MRYIFIIPWQSAKRLKTEHWGIIINGILALATVFLALGVSRQIGVMEDDQRPWVGIINIGVTRVTPSDSAIYFKLEIANSGRSPALDVSVTLLNWNTDIYTIRFPITRCVADCHQQHIEILSGSGFGMLIPDVDATQFPKVGDTGYVIARIDYLDPSGAPHITGICVKVVTVAGLLSRIIVDNISCTAPHSNYAN